MKCQNCGNNEVNYHYTQIVNGEKKEIALCSKCANELGANMWDFNMPIDFSDFLGDFFTGSQESLLTGFMNTEEIRCPQCKMTFEEFKNLGKFGCDVCYDTFSSKIAPILKSLQGADTHTGRKPKKAVQEETYEDAANIRDEIANKNKKE